MIEDERKGDCISYELLVTIVTRVGFCGYNFPVGGTHYWRVCANCKGTPFNKREAHVRVLGSKDRGRNLAGTRR
jgi:hypothetical protein